jgi:hypothetical protein
MSKSTRKVLYLSVPLALVGLGSVAVAMGFWLHPAAKIVAAEETSPTVTSGIPRSDDAVSVPQEEAAPDEVPSYTLRLPDFSLTGRYSRPEPMPPAWDPRLGLARPFPRIQERPGAVAGSRVRNPGVAIRGTTAAPRKRERQVAQKAPETMPQVMTTAPLPSTLASELKDHQREVERCADRNMVVGGKAPTSTGKIAVRWVVRSDGSSDQVQVDENTVIDKKLSKCVVNTVNRWRFTPRNEGEAHLKSTFVFL